MKTKKRNLFISALLVVPLLSACGGGSGDGSPTAASNSVISGVASKGLLAQAQVTAYCGIASSGNPIGSTTTDASGNYTLALTQACTQPVELVVTATSTPQTTIQDEISGSVPAPSNFSMRAFAPTPSVDPVTQHITPLTDMAAELVLASTPTGQTVSSAVASNAKSAIISNVLGGNAALFTAKPLAPSQFSDATTTPDQQQLIIFLSSLSAAAQSLPGDTTGDKVQAVLTLLATQAKQTVTNISADGYTVSSDVDPANGTGTKATPLATLRVGLNSLATKSLEVAGDAAVANLIVSNVDVFKTAVVDSAATQISQNASKGGPVSTPTPADDTLSSAIASARLLFANIRSNILSLSNSANTGYLQTRAIAMENDLSSLALYNSYHFLDILKATHRATAMLIEVNAALASNTTVVNAGYGSDIFGNYYIRSWSDSPNRSPILPNGLDSWRCLVYYTAGSASNSPTVTNSGNPVAICNHYIDELGTKQLRFIVKSPAAPAALASGASFPYINHIRAFSSWQCTNAASCSYTITNEVSGSLVATWDQDSKLTGVTVVAGNVTPYQGTTPATMDLAYTLATSNGTDTINFSGNLTSGNLKYGFGTGSTLTNKATTENGVTTNTTSAVLRGQIQTGAFQYDGDLMIDAGGTSASADASFSGIFSFNGRVGALEGGVSTPFLEGSLRGDSTKKSAALSFKVTNGSKVNNLSGQMDFATTGQQDATFTYTLPGYSISASGRNFDDTNKTSTLDVVSSDGTRIETLRSNGTSTTTVKNSAGATIGTAKGNQVNFVDNTFIVLN